MEIKITRKDLNNKTSFLTKITAVLFGIFITSVIFAISIKILEELGVYIGIAICALLTFISFYYIKKGTTLRLIAWGILVTTIIGVIAYFVGLAVLKNLLEGFSL